MANDSKQQSTEQPHSSHPSFKAWLDQTYPYIARSAAWGVERRRLENAWTKARELTEDLDDYVSELKAKNEALLEEKRKLIDTNNDLREQIKYLKNKLSDES